jgi:hypothetical protein
MSDTHDGQEGAGTVGGKWGCALSALVGLPLIGFAVLTSTLGDCLPEDACDRSLDWRLIGAALAIAAVVGFGSRAIINAIVRRVRSRD